jgi:hypothetical protein
VMIGRVLKVRELRVGDAIAVSHGVAVVTGLKRDWEDDPVFIEVRVDDDLPKTIAATERVVVYREGR